MNLSLSLTNNMGLSAAASEIPAAIVNNANTTVAGQGAGVYRITKTGGVDATWDADAVSSTAFSDNFLIRIDPLQVDAAAMLGVNSDPLANSSYTSLDRALFITSSSGAINIYEDNVQTAVGVVLHTAADFLFIRRVGTTLTALKGATNNVADATVFHTFTALAGDTYFDCSINATGAAFDVYAASTA